MRKGYRIRNGVLRREYGVISANLKERVIPGRIIERYRTASLNALKKDDWTAFLGNNREVISTVFEPYMARLSDNTMMIKLLRKAYDETTQRKIHSESTAKIGTKIAKNLGLNTTMVEMMCMYHDIGHTFYGHDGEWKISNVLEDYGLGVLVHNAEGARIIECRDKITDKIIEEIQKENPNASKISLKILKENLWKIWDGILCHNGENADTVFEPEKGKDYKKYIEDLKNCYIIPGYDRKIKPATLEGCLLRITDIISYVGKDMADGIREGLLKSLDLEDDAGKEKRKKDNLRSYEEILSCFGIDKAKVLEINELIRLRDEKGEKTEQIKEKLNEELSKIVEKIEARAMANVKKENGQISMEKTVLEDLYALRTRNNREIVSRVTKYEEHRFLPAVTNLEIEKLSKLMFEKQSSQKLSIYDILSNNIGNIQEALDTFKIQYKGTSYEAFIDFLSKINPEEYRFNCEITSKSMQASIKREIEEARAITEGKDKKDVSLGETRKSKRIIKYIEDIRKDCFKMTEEEKSKYIEQYKEKALKEIKNVNVSKNYITLPQGICIQFAAQFLASLNDLQFIEFLKKDGVLVDFLNNGNLTEEQRRLKELMTHYEDAIDGNPIAGGPEWNRIMERQEGKEEASK